MKKPLSHRTYPIMILGAVGAFSGIALLLYGSGSSSTSRDFTSTPEFTIWLFLIVAEMILFTILPVPLMADLRRLRSFLATNRVDLVVSAVMLTVLFWLPIGATGYIWTPVPEFPLAHHRAKMVAILAIGFVTTALPASIGVWLIRAALEASFRNIHPSEAYLCLYMRLRASLQRHVTILGAVVGLATPGTGGARKALIAWGVSADSYPSSFVLVYGAYFTMLIALVYIPTYSSSLDVGRRLCEAFVPASLPGTKGWIEKRSERKELENLLQLKATAQQSLKASVAILAPLLSGIISFALN